MLGGATSYTVSRATVNGGPYTKAGTVTSPAPTSFKDTGVTNGTTYYYVVSGTNSAGTSPNSAPLAATPVAPPTFTSSATASPNPVTQGASTTITAKVTCTARSLTGGIVQVQAVDPNGNIAATQNFTDQNFTKNQTHSYSLRFRARSGRNRHNRDRRVQLHLATLELERIGGHYRGELIDYIHLFGDRESGDGRDREHDEYFGHGDRNRIGGLDECHR